MAFYGAADAALPVNMEGHPTPVYELKAVTVTANRQAEDIQKVPANVSIITGSQIKARNVQNAAQAVALAPGVFVDQMNEGVEVHMRGYDSKSVLVLVDGQEMNSGYNGQVYWGTLPVDNISRIEVVKGGQSAMYGGNAVGGVINIITNTTRHDGVYGTVLEGYGTNNTVRQVYNVRGKEGKVTFGASYESRSTDGWAGSEIATGLVDSSSDSYRPSGENRGDVSQLPQAADGTYILGMRGRQSVMSETYGVQLGYNFSQNQTLNYKYTHGNYSWKYDKPSLYFSAEGHLVKEEGGASDKPSYINLKPSFMSSGTFGFRNYDMHTLTYNDQKALFHAHVGLVKYTKDGYTRPQAMTKWINGWYEGKGTKSEYPSQNVNFDMNKRWNLGDHTLLLGGAYSQGKFDQTVSNIDDWKDIHSTGKATDWFGGKVRSYALYGQDKWAFANKWTAYLGARYDHFEKFDGYYHNDAKNLDGTLGSQSYSQVSPKVSLEYAPDDSTTYYTSFGRSFNPPQMYMLYRSNISSKTYSKGNSALKPSSTDNWEVGFKKKLNDRTQIQLDAFKAKTKDDIQLVDLNEKEYGVPVAQYQNVGTADTKGVEFSMNHSFSDLWASYMDYTWQTGDVTVNPGSHAVIPRHIFRTGVTYTNHPWTVSLDGTFVSNRNADKHAPTGTFESYDPYFLLNLDSNYAFSKNVSLQFSVYNLLDREFYDDDLTEGRAYNVSLRYTF